MPQQQFPEPTVGGLIVNPQGEIFLMKSHKWKGLYVIPGGHIELGERMEDSLRREIKEETNLDIRDIEFLSFQEFIKGETFWERKHFIFFDFACKSEGTDVKLNDEAEEFVWVDPQKALDMPVEPATAAVIRTYLERQDQKKGKPA